MPIKLLSTATPIRSSNNPTAIFLPTSQPTSRPSVHYLTAAGPNNPQSTTGIMIATIVVVIFTLSLILIAIMRYWVLYKRSHTNQDSHLPMGFMFKENKKFKVVSSSDPSTPHHDRTANGVASKYDSFSSIDLNSPGSPPKQNSTANLSRRMQPMISNWPESRTNKIFQTHTNNIISPMHSESENVNCSLEPRHSVDISSTANSSSIDVLPILPHTPKRSNLDV